MNTAQRDMFDSQIRLEDQLIEMGATVNAKPHQHRVTTYTNNTTGPVHLKGSAGEYTKVERGQTVTAPNGEYYVKVQYPGTGWTKL